MTEPKIEGPIDLEQVESYQLDRSAACKKLLATSLDTESILKECEENMNLLLGSKYYTQQDKKDGLERFENAKIELNEIKPSLDSFLQQVDNLSQDEFQAKFVEFEQKLEKITERFYRYKNLPWWKSRDTDFPSYFVDVTQIGSNQEFREKRVLQWLPRKRDIARILAIAINAHRKSHPESETDQNKLFVS